MLTVNIREVFYTLSILFLQKFRSSSCLLFSRESSCILVKIWEGSIVENYVDIT